MRSAIGASLLFGVGLALHAFATPVVNLDDRASSPKCTTMVSGYMVTGDNARGVQNSYPSSPFVPPFFHPFVLNKNKEIAFFNKTTTPHIFAEFQRCDPNYYGSNNNGTYPSDPVYFGRVYIPASKSCVGAEDYGKVKHPKLKLMPCLNSAAGEMTSSKAPAQSFQYEFWKGRHTINWIGKSRMNSIDYEMDCPLLFGYWQHIPDGIPITGSDGAIQLFCNWDLENAVSAFELH